MSKLSLKRDKPKGSGISTLKSNDSSLKQRAKVKDRPEYKSLGIIMKALYRAGYKVKWKQPLSKEIYREIREALPPEVISSRKLYDAIGYHVRSVSYLLKMRPNVPRYNIHGKKDGVVSEAESKHALQQLLAYHAEYMRDRRKRQKKMIVAKNVVTTRKPIKPGERK